MNKIYKFAALLSVCLMAFAGCTTEELSTDQFVEDQVSFLGMGPNPVLRGGELRFMGSNLEKITEVRIPGVEPITDITQPDSLKGRVSEIRVIVPKDGPEIGKVVLVDAEGNEYTSQSELTYLEPIVISELSPAAVSPGDVLTIKGDYLTYMQEVIFSENVKVSVKEFKKHTRYEIQVVVPVEARTGLVALGDIDELNSEDKTLVPNIIYSEKELTVTQPEVTKMEAPRYKVGETVTITGKNFQYVASVKLPGKDVTDFKVNDNNTVITFALPAEAQDGEAYLVAKSKVEVLAGKYVTVAPTEVAVAPKPVKAGAVLTVSGKDLDVITTVSLPNSGDLEKFELKDGNITFTVPAEAQEGDVVLKMANGKEVKAAYTLVKPVITEYSVNPAAAGSPIKFTGTDLDLVVSVTFGGDLVVEVKEPAATEFEISVPTTAENGKLLFNLANGTAVEGKDLKVNKPVACYITELPGEDQEIRGGTVLVLPVANEDKLTGVQVNGEDVAYILNKTELHIALPSLAAKGTVIKLVSSNGEVEYEIDCIPDTIVENVLPVAEFDLGSWKHNQEILGEHLKAAGVEQDGAVLKFYVTPTGGYTQLKIADATWAEYTILKYDNEGLVPEVIEVPVTEKLLNIILNVRDEWNTDRVLWIQGENLIVNKIAVNYEISMEEVIWEGDVPLSWSAEGQILLDASLFAEVSPGSKLKITYFIAKATWGQVQICYGDWSKIIFDEYSLDENGAKRDAFVPTDFNGWTDKSSGTKLSKLVWQSYTGVTGDRSYYETWTANPVTITYKANKPAESVAYVNNNSAENLYTDNITFDSTITNLPSINLIGYDFKGYIVNADASSYYGHEPNTAANPTHTNDANTARFISKTDGSTVGNGTKYLWNNGTTQVSGINAYAVWALEGSVNGTGHKISFDLNKPVKGVVEETKVINGVEKYYQGTASSNIDATGISPINIDTKIINCLINPIYAPMSRL